MTASSTAPVVAVTGATGFLGRHLCKALTQRGWQVLPVSRSACVCDGLQVIGAGENFSQLAPQMIAGADCLIHCAARVHQLYEESMGAEELEAAYLAANVDAAMQAACAAREAGLRRFVFVSSVHVQARSTADGVVLCADGPCDPQSPYARSKYKAEKTLTEFCRDTGLELVVVRPPLVYGAGVKAKFEQLARWVASGKPLPFGALTDNRRSFVSVDNLTDFLLLCAEHEKAPGRAWLVADEAPVSTAQLIEALAKAAGVPVRNWAVPVSLLRAGLALIGKAGVLKVLDGSLALDIEDNARILGWRPRESMHDALKKFFEASHFGENNK